MIQKLAGQAYVRKLPTHFKLYMQSWDISRKELTWKTARQLGWEISIGSLGACDMCTVAKAKQKYLPETTKDKIAKGQIWMYINIATLKDQNNYAQIK